MRRQIRSKTPRDVPGNAIWGLDLCGKQATNGQMVNILGMVDHGSRLAVMLQPIAHMNSYTLAGHVLLAIGRHGKPKAIRTDNAPQLVSRQFQGFLKLLGIRHQRA